MSTLDDFADEPMVPEAKLLAARAERDSYKRQTGKLEKEIQRRDEQIADLLRLEGKQVQAPKWARKKKTKKNQATAVLMLSDNHYDEVVNPAQLIGPSGNPLNCYNREIAELRLEKTVNGFITVCDDLLQFAWDGAVLLLGGDMISGLIHDELNETNEAHPIESVDYWIDHLVAAIREVAAYFPWVLVVCVVGNHGRGKQGRPKAKNRVVENFDWLLYRQVMRGTADLSNVEWNIPESADAYFDVYDHTHLLTHGDQARGGSGIAGIATPIALLDHRKRKRDQAVLDFESQLHAENGDRTYSHLWIGHWHQYTQHGNVTINGSLIGANEYSYISNFGFEVPKQAMGVVTPKHGITMQAPIYSLDREAEGW